MKNKQYALPPAFVAIVKASTEAEDATIARLTRQIVRWYEGESIEAPATDFVWVAIRQALEGLKAQQDMRSAKLQANIQKRWAKAEAVKSIQTDTNAYKSIQNDTKAYKAIQDDTKPYKMIQTDTNGYKPIQSDTNAYKEEKEEREKEKFPPHPPYKEKEKKEKEETLVHLGVASCENPQNAQVGADIAQVENDANAQNALNAQMQNDAKAVQKQEDEANNAHFLAFWNTYNKKRNRVATFRAWEKARKDKANPMPAIDELLEIVRKWNATYEWSKEGGQYKPYPATWLNAKGWEDELPNTNTATNEPPPPETRGMLNVLLGD